MSVQTFKRRRAGSRGTRRAGSPVFQKSACTVRACNKQSCFVRICLLKSWQQHIFILTLLQRKKKRRWWQTQLYHSRSVSGGSSLLNDLRGQEMSGQFHNFTRMHSDDYDLLLNLIGPKIARKNTVFREAISVQERLAVTLRFLATGDSYTSLQYLFKFSKQSISKLCPKFVKQLLKY
jgi:hypothetical protein